jgi:hypothetical protein
MAQGDVKPFSRAGTDHLAYVLPYGELTRGGAVP